MLNNYEFKKFIQHFTDITLYFCVQLQKVKVGTAFYMI